MNRLLKLLSIFIILLLIFNCAKVDPVTGEKVLIDPNEKNRAREAKGVMVRNNLELKDFESQNHLLFSALSC